MEYEIDSGSSGFRVRAILPSAYGTRKRKPGKRGQCVGMSAASRRAMILWFLEREVPELPVWAVTLTVPECADAVEWRIRFKRFCARAAKDEMPFVWRVELQRRGVPHLHCVLYAESDGVELFRRNWLLVWGLLDHAAALRRAVVYRPITTDAWFSYVVFHQFKHSVQAVGWIGRHWGVVVRRRFEYRSTVRYRLTAEQYDRFRAILYWFLRREYRVRASAGRSGRMRHVPRFSGWSHVVSDWGFLVDRVIKHVTKLKVLAVRAAAEGAQK